MNQLEVRSLVLAEIGDQWNRTNLHGVNLRKCLVDPMLMKFTDPRGESSLDGWLVLREHPEKNSGYAVVYDEAAGKFGLAQFAEGYEPCLFGLYGDFFTTLDAM
jgi:hypothetical protein